MKKTLIINFKTYETGTGANAEKMAKLCNEVAARNKNIDIMLAVQAADIYRVAKAAPQCRVLAQHVDAISHGKNTGWVLSEAVKENGAFGTLLNHAEHRLPLDLLRESIKRAKEAGLFTVVCADTAENAGKIAAMRPDCIAIEDPALIAGKVSVAAANPTLITDAVRKIKAVAAIPALCGAGVNNKDDMKVALKLGTLGGLVANAVMNAEDPKKVVEELVSGLSGK